MTIKVGNAPCSWGVEFAGDPRNPSWQTVLKECAEAGYQGIELGPIGFMPEDPIELAEALAQHKLEMMAGVLYQPFHDANTFDDLLDKAHRTARTLKAHGANQLVLIDSISARRAPSAGRPDEAVKMDSAEWKAFVERIRTVAKLGTEEYGLTVSIHSHSAGFVDYLSELEQLLEEIDAKHLQLCVDTGHQTYAGFNPVDFMTRHFDRLAYVHFKDIDPAVKAQVIANRTGFYDACGQGIFCNLGKGEVNFTAVKQLLTDRGYNGWITVEQDCDPTLDVSPITDARANREFLASVGF